MSLWYKSSIFAAHFDTENRFISLYCNHETMKKELFNNGTKAQDFMRQPQQMGLYDASNEHDACGVGMIVNIKGGKSHELVESALKVLENMRHRGAEGADNKTGDGAGIMLQIPHEFILLQGIPVPEKGRYGTGLLFLPKN